MMRVIARGGRVVFLIACVGLAACAEAQPDPGVGPMSGPTNAAQPGDGGSPLGANPEPPIDDAVTLADHLSTVASDAVALAKGDPGEGDFGIVDLWAGAYPDVEFAGYAIAPDEDTISVYTNVQDSKNVPGPDNPYIVAGAIMDTGGTCAGVVAAGYPAPDDFSIVPVQGQCDPQSAAAEAGYLTN